MSKKRAPITTVIPASAALGAIRAERKNMGITRGLPYPEAQALDAVEKRIRSAMQDAVQGERRTILIAVDGGVASIIDETVPKDFEVEIIDYDNLREAPEYTFGQLSKGAQDFVLESNQDDPVFLALIGAKKEG